MILALVQKKPPPAATTAAGPDNIEMDNVELVIIPDGHPMPAELFVYFTKRACVPTPSALRLVIPPVASGTVPAAADVGTNVPEAPEIGEPSIYH